MVLGRDEGEEQLGEFGDSRYRVQVCFAQGADAHYAEEEGEDEGEEGEGYGDHAAEGVLDCEDAEGEGEGEAEEGGFDSDQVFGWGVVFFFFVVVGW